MANVRTKKATVATAASGRKTRIPGRKPSPKPKPASKVKKAVAPPKANTVVKKAAGGSATKKKRRSVSVATKMKKKREASRAKRGEDTADCDDDDDDDDEQELRLPKGAPKPEKVLNTELNEEGLEWEAEKVVASRLNLSGGREYHVKWKGWPTSANTWEPEINLANSFDLITEFDQKNPDAA